MNLKKMSLSSTKIAELYVKRLKTIYPYVTEKPLELINEKNSVIFHFVFASKNATALNNGERGVAMALSEIKRKMGKCFKAKSFNPCLSWLKRGDFPNVLREFGIL